MIAGLLSNVAKADDLAVLMPLLLTTEELNAINGRLLIFRELLLGEMSQREIAKHHNISIATITRGSNNLKTMSANEKQLLHTLLIGK